MKMIASERAKELIRKYEGLRLFAYKCPAGVWTIGYGNTRQAMPNTTITIATAEKLLEQDCIAAANSVNKLLVQSVNQNQFDALVSFVFNLGAGNLGSSTLLRKVNMNPNDPSISAEFSKWVNANGKPLSGLIKRRKEEAELYFTKP